MLFILFMKTITQNIYLCRYLIKIEINILLNFLEVYCYKDFTIPFMSDDVCKLYFH